MEVLRKLAGAWSPSGNEEPVAKLIKEQIAQKGRGKTGDAVSTHGRNWADGHRH